MTAGNFLAGLAQGFGQAQVAKKERERHNKLAKLQGQLLELQLQERMDKQQAQSRIASALAPDTSMTGATGPGEPPQAAPAPALMDVLSDPTLMSSFMQVGVNPAQIAGIQQKQQGLDIQRQGQERMAEMWAQLQAQGGAAGAGVSGGGMSGGLSLGSLNFSSSGPSVTFEPREIARQAASEDGSEVIFYDKQGNEVSRIPNSPDIVIQQIMDDNNEPVMAAFDKNRLSAGPVSILGRAKEEKVSPEQAGRIAALQQGAELVPMMRDAIFPGGELNEALILSANAPGGGIGEGRLLRSRFRTAADAIIRSRTGAAANESELQGIFEELFPSARDMIAPAETRAKIVRDKLNRMAQFLNGSLDVVTLPDRLRKKIGKGGGGTSKRPEQMTDEEILKALGGG